MMKAVRWVTFLPAAFIASVVAGAFGTFMANFVGEAIWFQHIVSGICSGVAMILVGVWVAPCPTRGVKWVLVILLIVLGALSAVGGLLGPERGKALTGLAMLLSGAWAMKLTPAELAQRAREAFDPEHSSSSGPGGTAAEEPMGLWHHLNLPGCAAAEATVRRFGVVLDDLRTKSAGEPHEFVHGWPESFLPFPKNIIESALLRYTSCLAATSRLNQEKREVLRSGYGALAWFVSETEAMEAARVAQVQIAGSDDEAAAVGSPAWKAANDLFDRALAECEERHKAYDEFVKSFEQKPGSGDRPDDSA